MRTRRSHATLEEIKENIEQQVTDTLEMRPRKKIKSKSVPAEKPPVKEITEPSIDYAELIAEHQKLNVQDAIRTCVLRRPSPYYGRTPCVRTNGKKRVYLALEKVKIGYQSAKTIYSEEISTMNHSDEPMEKDEWILRDLENSKAICLLSDLTLKFSKPYDFSKTLLTVSGDGYEVVIEVFVMDLDLGNVFAAMFCANGYKEFSRTTYALYAIMDEKEIVAEIPEIENCKMVEHPDEDFLLELFDYQLRTLSWMIAVEEGSKEQAYYPNFARLENGTYFDWQNWEIEDSPCQEKNVRGGIIADKPGVGKTITTLALIYVKKYNFSNEDFLYTEKDSRLVSRATLIFAPNNICQQWYDEVSKCFGSDKLKVIQIKGKAGYTCTNLKDLLLADIIIVSYNFLQNGVYKGSKISARCELSERKLDFDNKEEIKAFAEKKNYLFNWIHFHRIVFDEFHEIEAKQRALRSHLSEMAADSKWGLTGTPALRTIAQVNMCAGYLTKPMSWVNAEKEAYEFIANRVRKNNQSPTCPPPVYTTVQIRQTMPEIALYRSSKSSVSPLDLLMLCSHYQISQETLSAAGQDSPLTIEEVGERIQESRISTAKSLKKCIEDLRKQHVKLANSHADVEEEFDLVCNDPEEWRKQYSEIHKGKKPPKDLTKTFERLEKRVEAGKLELQRLLSKLNQQEAEHAQVSSQIAFFENFTKSYLSSELVCAICMEEELDEVDIAIFSCGHTLCWECSENLLKDGPAKCPNCRRPVEKSLIMKLMALDRHQTQKMIETEAEQQLVDEENHLDPNKFGSKIRELVQYLKDVIAQDDQHRCVVFSQWSNLSRLVSQALDTYGIRNVRMAQGWNHREKALQTFRAGISQNSTVRDPVRVLMLSATDSVSGLNLTEVSHMIILHPFYSETEEDAVAAETQGVARALRLGQTRNVQVVRFVVRNTIEEEIHDRRTTIENVEPEVAL